MSHLLEERRYIPVGPAPVQLVAVDGGRSVVALASGDSDTGWGSHITILDGDVGDVRATVDVGPSPRNAAALGHLLYIALHTEPPEQCRDAIQVVDVRTCRLVATIDLPPESRAMMVVRGDSAQRMYAPNWGNATCSEIDTSDNRVVRTIDVGTQPEFGLSFGQAMYVANAGSNDLTVIETAGFAEVARIPVGAQPTRIVPNNAQRELFVTNSASASVSIVSVAAGKVVATLNVGDEPFRVAPWDSRGRNEFVVLSRGGRDGPRGEMAFVDGPTRQITETVSVPGRVANWTWANPAQRELVYVTLGDTPRLAYFDAVRAQIAGTLDLSQQPEPTGYGPGLIVGRGGLIFVATREPGSGEGSVTILAPS